MLSVVMVALMCTSYFVNAYVFSWFFSLSTPKISARSFSSIGIIALCIIGAFIAALIIPDIELGNRIQHGFGGGFTAFLSIYLACRDCGIVVDRLKFAVLGLLVVTAMGVGNEILEFVLQLATGVVFSANVFDTWRDLTSNTVGAVAAALLFTPILRKG